MQLALKAFKVLRELMELLARPDQLALRVIKALLVQPVRLALRVIKALLVQSVRLALRARPVRPDPLAQRELTEPMERLEQPASRATLAPQAPPAIPV